MWALVNRTPFAAERGFVRDENGAEIWVVVVRGTFSITQDQSTLPAPEQKPALLAPVYMGEPGASSLRYDADLVQTKSATDVLVHGHAHSPDARPKGEMMVRLSVGPVDKTLLVTGDRVWTGDRDNALDPPVPFLKMPLIYERAWGGLDPGGQAREPRNPVGRGFALKPADLAGRAAPNVDFPRQGRASGAGHDLGPAGFGPIARDWAPRLGFAGTHDRAWQEKRLPLPPGDFDRRFFQSAPEDQQVAGHLKGGEDVQLFNLTPSGYLRFRLPRVALGFVTNFLGHREFHAPTLHTVAIEPDENRLTMVWHTAIPCHDRIYDLKDTIVQVKEKRLLGSRRPVGWRPRSTPAARPTNRARP